MNGLSKFQTELARLFFSLPSSRGYLLAGGGALLANGLTSRPTHDLDFFGSSITEQVETVVADFTRSIVEAGLSVTVVQATPDFVRLLVSHHESLVIDIGLDSPPIGLPHMSQVGPTFDLLELAGRNSRHCSAGPRRGTLLMSMFCANSSTSPNFSDMPWN